MSEELREPYSLLFNSKDKEGFLYALELVNEIEAKDSKPVSIDAYRATDEFREMKERKEITGSYFPDVIE